MSFNRKTRAYQLRVKTLAKQFEYPKIRRSEEDSQYRAMTFDEIIAAQPQGTPRCLIEDALAYVVEDAQNLARSFQEQHLRQQALATAAAEKLKDVQRPKIQLVRVV